ncbi:unnamed protein product, partial [Owenia fusiformis]
VFFFVLHGAYLAFASATYPTCPGDCYHGDYIPATRRQDILYGNPSCPALDITEAVYNTSQLCFAKACELGGNVIQHNYRGNNTNFCGIYKCESNVNGTNWNYDWVMDEDVKGHISARPHPYIPKCHSSYF